MKISRRSSDNCVEPGKTRVEPKMHEHGDGVGPCYCVGKVEPQTDVLVRLWAAVRDMEEERTLDTLIIRAGLEEKEDA